MLRESKAFSGFATNDIAKAKEIAWVTFFLYSR
jgi:hypothetical protein